ncbi:hypothetical protein Misp01_02100 [Microtetraspora sp. NBRC 13810]|uniref:hypothetical protein n=1 Tax=Microtetraspora sp. NBRC 13810 TaxID=3030990 RepID=UPI0024A4486E|nr:hypothetical protein [Microtetraspora sp. NBRC 13810]GLW05080.1 hypothetical protein Misp01_02100 [Microtetraspora sp. NBRC 13810]
MRGTAGRKRRARDTGARVEVRRHKGVSREELKQSTALTVALLLVLGLAAAWSVLIPGVDAWENIVVAVIGSLRLTGPVAAAFACWVAVRKRRVRARRALTTWRALKPPLAIMTVVAGSFAATALLLAVRSVLSEHAGRIPPSGLAMGMAGLALYVSIGWVVGWMLPRAWTPLLAALGCYALFAWLAMGPTWADRLAPATREPYDVFRGLSASEFMDQTLWLVGASTAVLLGWAAAVTRRVLVLAAASLAVLAAATGVARLVDQPQQVSAVQHVVYSCQEWPITVCVHPGMRSGLPVLGEAFTTIASRLAGTPAEFSRVEQRPYREGPTPGSGTVPVHMHDLAAGFADKAVADFLNSLAAKCPDHTAAGYRAIVMSWLRGEPLPPSRLPGHRYATTWFSSQTEAQRREWLRMFYADFTRCSLRGEHFGGGPHLYAQPRERTELPEAPQPHLVPPSPREGATAAPAVPQPGQSGPPPAGPGHHRPPGVPGHLDTPGAHDIATARGTPFDRDEVRGHVRDGGHDRHDRFDRDDRRHPHGPFGDHRSPLPHGGDTPSRPLAPGRPLPGGPYGHEGTPGAPGTPGTTPERAHRLADTA